MPKYHCMCSNTSHNLKPRAEAVRAACASGPHAMLRRALRGCPEKEMIQLETLIELKIMNSSLSSFCVYWISTNNSLSSSSGRRYLNQQYPPPPPVVAQRHACTSWTHFRYSYYIKILMRRARHHLICIVHQGLNEESWTSAPDFSGLRQLRRCAIEQQRDDGPSSGPTIVLVVLVVIIILVIEIHKQNSVIVIIRV